MNDSTSIRPFHLAFPVQDLKETEIWYTTILGCTTGRKSNKWIDFNFFGHQVVAHFTDNIETVHTNQVDNDSIKTFQIKTTREVDFSANCEWWCKIFTIFFFEKN